MRDEEHLWNRLLSRLIRLADLLIAILEVTHSTTLHLATKEGPMADFQLNSGDSVVVTVTDTDDVTGAVVTPDAGSLSVVISSSTDALVANADGTYTLTAGTTASVGNTVTATATFGGLASTPGVGTYDVVVPTPPPVDATTLSVTFGTDTPPAPTVTAAAETVPAGTFRNS